MAGTVRLAVAQTTVPEDPTDPGRLRESGAQIRALLGEAHAAGATLVQFPEGAITYPGKRVMSSGGPSRIAAAAWGRLDWEVLRAEARAVADTATALGVWAVFGAPHQLTAPHRPHNSLYVVAPDGRLAARYDKRYLSQTELSYLYTPGRDPALFAAGGLRFGCALCIEVNFPELFAEYEAMDADCVLISMMVDDPVRPVIAQAYAALHSYWVGYATPAQFSRTAPAGIIAPGGRWLARCPADGQPALAVADLDPDAGPDLEVALERARPWRRRVRAGLHRAALVTGDPRSDDRASF